MVKNSVAGCVLQEEDSKMEICLRSGSFGGRSLRIGTCGGSERRRLGKERSWAVVQHEQHSLSWPHREFWSRGNSSQLAQVRVRRLSFHIPASARCWMQVPLEGVMTLGKAWELRAVGGQHSQHLNEYAFRSWRGVWAVQHSIATANMDSESRMLVLKCECHHFLSVPIIYCYVTKHPKLNDLNDHHHLFIVQICNLGRIQWGQLLAALHGVSWSGYSKVGRSKPKKGHMAGNFNMNLSRMELGLLHSVVAGFQR